MSFSLEPKLQWLSRSFSLLARAALSVLLPARWSHHWRVRSIHDLPWL